MTVKRTSEPGARGEAAWEVLVDGGLTGGRGRGRALQGALREAVRTGRLGAGTQLPSSRELAADLHVSRGLVTDAYAQLTAEGYLTSRQGAGTWVAQVRGEQDPRPAPVFAPDDRGGPDDLRPGLPDLALFPRAAWSAAHRRVMAKLPHRALGYPDPRGLPELRAALAALLARRRGVAAEPDQVVVTSGVAQAHTLVGLVLHARGQRTTAVEDPGSPEHTALLAATGLAAVPVPVDGQGLSVAALAACGARSAVVTPCHQFPSGVAYSPARRAALADWARGCGGVVVEDDYDGDFRYDRQPVGALQGLAPGHVVYTGSASKSLAPGLRLGWMVGPQDLVAEAAQRKRTMDLGHSVTEQAALADFLLSGAYDRHLRRCQRLYRARRDALVAALAEHAPGAEVSGIAAGLHAIVTLPVRFGPEPRLLAAAAGAGVAVRPLSYYRAAPGAPDGDDGLVRLVVGYAHLPPEGIARAVRLLLGHPVRPARRLSGETREAGR
ncbi:MocR-like pyridoxine biosynthesis transcription factor PdxR [Actinacidiphila bryophytorum]|uniref:GntR family transcriptional regulator / MocR family aminotransferase n=1 Tax=Actinacidiphila bryophytorum TaxID=1436133 RepID=A0A9W4MLE1_9ACTN|nr:PLP-dependent aminotransferase family protein [Actinacidiphila bryophytorum]MBM9438373.1 PLP-dependent aminotransferase family protein [Actinacidiphila bryophytorum]MBN6543666.1 PLP-dependent aminotransferase family protein [Actinacidiphila bryophytorum]CAG7658195.1 GntR family transcriptional regulator / MocR family aminotransferase [Actinacidiphila bryophytorum]